MATTTRFLRGGLDSRLYNVLSLLSLFLGCLVAVICLYILPRFFRKLRRRHRQMRMARQRAANSTEQNDLVVLSSTSSPDERYAAIENWLISKPVTRHDAICEEVQTFRSVLKSRQPSSNSLSSMMMDNNDNDTQKMDPHECSICYETFEEGDIVSWSPNSACENHVFHHGCIKEWLLLHKACPYCRVTFLPVDLPNAPIREFLAAHQQRFLPAFFCQTHGIVRPPNSMLITPHHHHNNNKAKHSDHNNHHFQELHNRSHHLCCREELQRIRGMQQQQTTTEKENDDDPTIIDTVTVHSTQEQDTDPESNESSVEEEEENDDCTMEIMESSIHDPDSTDIHSEVSPSSERMNDEECLGN